MEDRDPEKKGEKEAVSVGQEEGTSGDEEKVSSPSSRRVIRVLVVDDSQLIRMIVRKHLESRGMIVEEATNGHEAFTALRRARNSGAPIDVILSDLMMPEMDGFEFVKRLREKPEFMHIPVVISSTRSDPESVLQCKKFGIRGYILKPFNPQRLIQTIEEAAHK